MKRIIAYCLFFLILQPLIINSQSKAIDIDNYPYKNSLPNQSDAWSFATRNCTSYVAWRINEDYGATLPQVYFSNNMKGPNNVIGQFGHAYKWANNASSLGFEVNTYPKRGSIAYWSAGSGGAGDFGHVAYVEKVNSDNTVNISEYNWNYNYSYNQKFNVRADKYIHIKNIYKVPSISLFDKDNGTYQKKDLTLFRPNQGGGWHSLLSTTKFTVLQSTYNGGVGDIAVPGDYDNDGVTDSAIFRAQESKWYILESKNSVLNNVTHGGFGDIPVQADYDGDGKTDIAIYRPSDGFWYIIRSRDGWYQKKHGGALDDIPIAADFTGDGRADLGIFRVTEKSWYIIDISNGNFRTVSNLARSGDVPVPADYDGDRVVDPAIFRASDKNWYILESKTNIIRVVYNFGAYGDIPVPGDYDGNGKADTILFRPNEKSWYIKLESGILLPAIYHGGAIGEEPI